MSMKNLKQDGETLNNLYLEHLAQTLDKLLSDNPTLQVRIFMIRGGERESDAKVSNQLHAKLARQHASRVIVIPHDPDPQVIMQQIGECRAFIATRFHAALLSYLCGCRLMFLAYHRKVADLANEIGLHPDAVLPILTDISPNLLRDRIVRLVTAEEWYQPTLRVDEAVRRANESINMWRELGDILK